MRRLTLTLASLQSQEQQCQEEEAAGKKDSKGRPLLCRGQRCGRGSVAGTVLSPHVQRLPRQEGQGARARVQPSLVEELPSGVFLLSPRDRHTVALGPARWTSVCHSTQNPLPLPTSGQPFFKRLCTGDLV